MLGAVNKSVLKQPGADDSTPWCHSNTLCATQMPDRIVGQKQTQQNAAVEEGEGWDCDRTDGNVRLAMMKRGRRGQHLLAGQDGKETLAEAKTCVRRNGRRASAEKTGKTHGPCEAEPNETGETKDEMCPPPT